MAGTFRDMGYKVHLVGRKKKHSLPLPDNENGATRFNMIFRKGPLFYAAYNLRLFFYLLSRRRPLFLVSVDLDTLPATYLAGRIRGIPILYDSHEYFTEVPELADRSFVRKVWEIIERAIVPRLHHAIAVSDSIANAYTEKYGVPFNTIRNFSRKRTVDVDTDLTDAYPSKYRLIYQGALNLGRGIELMIDSMQWLPETTLFIVGDGDISVELKQRVYKLHLSDRVVFPGRIPPDKLIALTSQCDLGLSLEEDMGLNYRWALPNKIFDYIQARIPVLCSDLPEMAGVIERFEIGQVCKSREPEAIAHQISWMVKDQSSRDHWKQMLEIAASELCWEREEVKLKAIISEIIG